MPAATTVLQVSGTVPVDRNHYEDLHSAHIQTSTPPHNAGVARVAAVFGSTSGRLSAFANFILFISLSCGCPWGASPRSRAIAFDRIRAFQFSSSSLSRLVYPPQFSFQFLILFPLLSLPVLLPLAAVAWSSFRHRSAIFCLFAIFYCPLSSSRCPTSVAGPICLVSGSSSFAIHVLFSLFLSLSLFLVYLSDLGSECLL